MRALGFWLLSCLALSLAGCSANNSCCSDGNCWANYVCTAQCATNGNVKGVCAQRCQVDADCSALGEVCNQVNYDCACELPSDGGQAGSCPQGY